MIDQKTQASLREKYNPDGSKLRNLQLQLVEMLKDIDAFCQENNIPYWISSGTLLGAIRHEGFIPWDDDIDIEMYKEDFDRFQQIATEKGFNNPNYHILNHSTDPNYFSLHSKIVDTSIPIEDIYNQTYYHKYKGVFLDIFPIEKNLLITYKIFQPWDQIVGRLLRHTAKNKLIWWGTKCLYYVCYQGFIKNVSRFTSLFASHYYDVAGSRWPVVTRDKTDILPLKKYLFEGVYFLGPRNTDKYLKMQYGNYMEIPQLEERQIHLIINP